MSHTVMSHAVMSSLTAIWCHGLCAAMKVKWTWTWGVVDLPLAWYPSFLSQCYLAALRKWFSQKLAGMKRLNTKPGVPHKYGQYHHSPCMRNWRLSTLYYCRNNDPIRSLPVRQGLKYAPETATPGYVRKKFLQNPWSDIVVFSALRKTPSPPSAVDRLSAAS